MKKVIISVLSLLGLIIFINDNTVVVNADSSLLEGITVEQTVIYDQPSTESNLLRTYQEGVVINFRDYNSNWYTANVFVKGEGYQRGYLLKESVERANLDTVTIEGMTAEAPTVVFDDKGRKIRELAVDRVVKFKNYSSSWVSANVFVEGDYQTGFIEKNSIDLPLKESSSHDGLAALNPTNVYDRKGNIIKKFDLGRILRYQDFTTNWHTVYVYANGKYQTAYVKASSIEKTVENAKSFEGITNKASVPIYGKNGEVIREFTYARTLKFREFSNSLYQVNVYADGEYRKGYVSSDHVEKVKIDQNKIDGITISDSTIVFDGKGNEIKKYNSGEIIGYRKMSDSWYSAYVYTKNGYKNGHIHMSDLEHMYNEPKSLTVFAKNAETMVYSKPSTDSKTLDTLYRGIEIDVKHISNNWYQFINNDNVSGYIHINSISQDPVSVNTTTEYNYSLDEMVDIQMRYGAPQTDKYRNLPGYVHSSLVSNEKKTAINSDGVNIRLDSTLDSAVYKKVNSGTEVEIIKEVSGDEWQGSTKWFNIRYDNQDNLYVHASLVSTKNFAYLNSTSNIREDTNTNSHIYTRMSKGTSLNIIGEQSGETISKSSKWYEIAGLGTWRNAKRSDVKVNVNPDNLDRFEFLILSGSAETKPSDLAPVLESKGILNGKESAFLKARDNFNINEIYLISHALLETGNGTSLLAKGVYVDENGTLLRNKNGDPITESSNAPSNATKVHNMYGIGAKDSCPLSCGSKMAFDEGWNTPYKAIVGGAEWVSERYVNNSNYHQDTLYKMRWNPAKPGTHQYATDVEWAIKQIPSIKTLYDQVPNAVLKFDFPKYLK